jgi:diaminopropionate ammonia-lyase
MGIFYHPNESRARQAGPEVNRLFPVGTCTAVRRFHESLPGYRPTPLLALPGLARRLGVADIRVKD